MANGNVFDALLDEEENVFDSILELKESEIAPPSLGLPPEFSEFGRNLSAIGQTIFTFGSGIAAVPTAGVVGVSELGYDLIVGNEDALSNSVETIHDIMEALTFQPKTPEAEALTSFVSTPFVKFEEFATEGTAAVAEISGSPALGAGAKAVLMTAPAATGLRGVRPSARVTRGDVFTIKKAAKELGLDINKNMLDIEGQFGGIAKRQLVGQTQRGTTLPPILEAILEAEQLAKKHKNLRYEVFRATPSSINTFALKPLMEQVNVIFKERFDLSPNPKDMVTIKNRLRELDIIAQRPATATTSKVSLRELEIWRSKLGSAKPAANFRDTESAMINILRGQYDNWLQTEYNAGLITGNPKVHARLMAAREANTRYKKTFKEDKVVNDLLNNQQAIPEEISNWIFGAESVLGKKDVGAVIGRLKAVLGEDSAAFSAIRQEQLFRIIEPLLNETPDLAAFIRNYDNLVLKRPTTVAELFPNQKKPLAQMRVFAGVLEGIKGEGFNAIANFKLNETLSRLTFGHAIAKAQVRVSMGALAISMIRKATGQTAKKKIIDKFLGYDSFNQVLNIKRATVIQTGANQPELDPRIVEDLKATVFNNELFMSPRNR